MSRQIQIEIVGRDEFWQRAVLVEWQNQFPVRELIAKAENKYLIEANWLDDLRRVAGECFSEVIIAPTNPGRRLLFQRLIPYRQKKRDIS